MVEIKGQMLMQVKALEDASEGGFSGILSTYGNIDEVGDVCESGCFDASVASAGPRRTLLWQHDPSEPIGQFSVVGTQKALEIDGSFNLDTQRGREAYSLLKRGDINGLSIGYIATDYSYDADGVRHLKAVDLLEGSLVTFPANRLATAQAKSRRLERMSRFARCKFLAKMSEEDRNAALAELDAMDEDQERPKEADTPKEPEKAPEDEPAPEDDRKEEKPDEGADGSMVDELRKLRASLDETIKKMEG